jgi:hypothetical protein
MGNVDDKLLMRYHDGELDAEERRAVEAALDDRARATLAALGDLGLAVRGALTVEDSVDVWAGVAGKIGGGPLARLRKAMAAYRSIWIPALAAAAVVVAIYAGPWRRVVTNGCDIESLEVSGAAATILKVPTAEKGDDTTTVLWLEEEMR